MAARVVACAALRFLQRDAQRLRALRFGVRRYRNSKLKPSLPASNLINPEAAARERLQVAATSCSRSSQAAAT